MNAAVFSSPRPAARRPYWLLFALALFLAGQFAAANHWHDGGNTSDYDCALCVLSSVGAHAISPTAPSLPAPLPAAFVITLVAAAALRPALRFYAARGPPSLLQNR